VVARVVVVATSPRTPPGLLSWPAWQALSAGPVLTRDADHPQLSALRAAGVAVEVLDRPDGDAALGRELADRAGEVLVWLAAGPADADLVRAVGDRLARSGGELEVLHGSWDPPGARLLDVVAVMDRLRSPGGCPWDAQQSHTSLMPYLLEEAYEAYAALEDGDLADLREELGDVLLQVAFHARLAEELPEAERWSIDDVAGDLVDKLVRRHPHVFAGGSADDLEGTWDALKAQEKGRTSVTEGVPLSQPALALAAKLQKRAGRLGVPVPAYDGPGGALWDLVARCRDEGVDPEVALRAVARAFRDRLAELEREVRGEGGDPAALSPEQWRQRWA
jgi:XTP/dITP diphosphohydrolase